MLKSQMFFRRIDAVNYLEYFLVSAIAAVLIIRLFLELTGYPQVGGDTLHIAHMLWGGLFMLVALILLFSFIGRVIENISAIIGGIGFGTFIDEIGKFITQDNDYFFQPSVALIYLVFILIYLVIRAIHRNSEYSAQEYLLNALREIEELAINDLDADEKKRAIDYLDRSGYQAPLADSMKKVLLETTVRSIPPDNLYQKTKVYIRSAYQNIAVLPAFKYAIIAFFLFQFITQFSFIVILIFFKGAGWEKILNLQVFQDIIDKSGRLSFVEGAEILSASISGIFTFLGIWLLPKSRIRAYRMFERSILISIFVTQVFVFYKEQFGALVGLILNIFILLGVQFMISREHKTNPPVKS